MAFGAKVDTATKRMALTALPLPGTPAGTLTYKQPSSDRLVFDGTGAAAPCTWTHGSPTTRSSCWSAAASTGCRNFRSTGSRRYFP